MSDFDTMEYRFVSFRFFIAGFIILVALFLLVWIVGAQVDVTVNSEPFIMTFEITLDQNATNVLFNLDTIPAQIVDEMSDGYEKEYIVVSEFKNSDTTGKGSGKRSFSVGVTGANEVSDARGRKPYGEQSSRASGSDYVLVDELKNENNNTIFVFKQDDLKQLVAYKVAALFEESDVEKQIFIFHPKSWEINVLHKDIVSGIARILISVQEEVVPIYDVANLKDMIRFKSVDKAKQMLMSVPGIKWVTIDIFPPFYSRLPVFDSRINFLVHP
ncbi:hypothetical protein MYX06_02705 [Patescibacteria group bacterium AH-259-L05]|nr:hypothetical protein [Patescibacteria group bacterium AH-259-L05]